MKVSAGDHVGFEAGGVALRRADMACPERSRRSIRPYMASHEDKRIVYRGVDFDLKNFATVSERVANCAVDLRHAAQRIGVLHAVAVEMRFAQPAAAEHLAQIRSCFELAGMRARLMNAFIESHVRATQSVQR